MNIGASANSIIKGSSVNLAWTSENATSLDLEPGVGKVGPSGTADVTPAGTTTYKITATGPGGEATASTTVNVPCLTPWEPPSQLSAIEASGIHLAWTNPNTKAGQTCPAPPNQVLIYRMGANGYDQIATVNSNNGILPSRYTDSGPFQPHMGYFYEVCEGGPPNWQYAVNCAAPHGVQQGTVNYGVITQGADPILTATRTGSGTVKLKLSLDQYTVTSITVTRQESDDPCRQGGTLGNGLQGCKTTNGMGASPAQTDTVYSWNTGPNSQYPSGFQFSKSAPFMIDLPDDTSVKPGVEYYYHAQVTWLYSVTQSSGTVTVPSVYATAPMKTNVINGPKPIKLNGSAPQPPAQLPAAPKGAANLSTTTVPQE